MSSSLNRFDILNFVLFFFFHVILLRTFIGMQTFSIQLLTFLFIKDEQKKREIFQIIEGSHFRD